MCRPTHFAVTYKINPWMDPTAPYDTALAISQWEGLKAAYERPLVGLDRTCCGGMVIAKHSVTVILGGIKSAARRSG